MESLDEFIAGEIPLFHNITNTLQTHVTESITGVTKLIEKIKNEEDRGKGLSFLEMKCQLFLEYLINVTYSMLLKINGKQISGEPCIEHLVEIRTILSKIRPIEKKLKYQIDKCVKMANPDPKNPEQNALSFKPNLDNLGGNDDEDSDEDDENETENKSDAYVPPKITAVHYDGDKLSKEEKRLENARKRSLNSNLIADMKEEFSEEPVEISDGRYRSMHQKLKEKMDERELYEESTLRRLTVSKKDKMMKRKLNELDEVVKVGNFGNFGEEDDSDGGMEMPKTKKKKGKRFGGGGGSGGKGKFKKRMQRKGK